MRTKEQQRQAYERYIASRTPEQLEEIRARSRDRARAARLKNPISHAERAKKSRARHKEKRLEDTRRWRAINRDRVAAYNKQWCADNADKAAAACAEWYAKNRSQVAAKRNFRYQSDPRFKVLVNLRGRLYQALSRRLLLGYKSRSVVALIGCSIDSLMAHLESQFSDGMTWENYGAWHIDHKVPCASFDLSEMEEQQKCFHYLNLQPLWAVENIRKGARVPSTP